MRADVFFAPFQDSQIKPSTPLVLQVMMDWECQSLSFVLGVEN